MTLPHERLHRPMHADGTAARRQDPGHAPTRPGRCEEAARARTPILRRRAPRPPGRTAAYACVAALPALLACCAGPGPDPVAAAQDRSAAPAPSLDTAVSLPGFGGHYAGLWTPAPDGSCARLAAIPRDMLVEAFTVTSGVNYPLRGLVAPDGSASLSYGKVTLAGRFGPDGFAGHADSGDGCSWLVTMVREPPIGLPPDTALPAEAVPVEGEIPVAQAWKTPPP